MFASFLYSDEMPANEEEKSLSTHMVPSPCYVGDEVAWHIITRWRSVALMTAGSKGNKGRLGFTGSSKGMSCLHT